VSRIATAPAEAEQGGLDEQLLALLRAGRKIDAIKVYRERTQAGLKEAKDAVEALAAEHGVAPQKSGCAGVLLLILAGVAALACAAWHG
jgi:ribosomal protein L7/L12